MKELVTHVMSLGCSSAQSQTTLFPSCPADVVGGSNGFPGRPLLDWGSKLSFSTRAIAASFVSSSSVGSRFGYAFNFREVSVSTFRTRQYMSDSFGKDFLSTWPLPVVMNDYRLVNTCNKAHLTWSAMAGQDHTRFENQRSFDKSRFKTLSLILDKNPATGEHRDYENRGKLAGMKEPKLFCYSLKPVRGDGGFTFRKMLTFHSNTNSTSIRQIATNLFEEKINWKFKSSTADEKKSSYEI